MFYLDAWFCVRILDSWRYIFKNDETKNYKQCQSLLQWKIARRSNVGFDEEIWSHKLYFWRAQNKFGNITLWNIYFYINFYFCLVCNEIIWWNLYKFLPLSVSSWFSKSAVFCSWFTKWPFISSKDGSLQSRVSDSLHWWVATKKTPFFII